MGKAYSALVISLLLISSVGRTDLIKTRVIDGTIVMIDKEKIIVRDSSKKEWNISRTLLKESYKLMTGERFHSVFNENEVSEVKK